MRNNYILDPEERVLYGDSLQPPPGYVFDAAVATTYSLDFETALAAPVSLALFAVENRDAILLQPLALLEGAERIVGRLLIYMDAGRIHAHPQPQSRLCSLLERMIVQVTAPRGGSFHPKIWVLRFKPIGVDVPVCMRLLVLSRNLTRDRCWDLSLRLDGDVTRRPQGVNRPLVDFLKDLPDLAMGMSQDARALTKELAEDLRHVAWEVPDPFETVEFAVNGLSARSWRPDPCARLGVIAPFCDDDALGALAALPAAEKSTLIGRAEELAAISQSVLDQFEVRVLDETASSDDGEDTDLAMLQGLHAKAFISESGWNTIVTVGSGNATRPALLNGRNVEVFATLTGKRSKVKGIDEIMGPQGFGRLTRPFTPGELQAPDPEQRAADARVEDARRALAQHGLQMRCERVPAEEGGESLWRLWLMPAGALPLDGIGVLRVWPITRGEDHGRAALDALRDGAVVDLGAMPLIDLTRFLAFRLTDVTGRASVLFTVGLPADGLPAERHAAILRWIIDSREAFLRYLRLLLLELGDPFGAALAAQNGAGTGSWGAHTDDAPLLEDMVRAFCRDRDRLHAVERLVARLESSKPEGADPIPDDFRVLWETFRAALKDVESADVH